MRCNLCGHDEFLDLPMRKNAQCKHCYAYERTRVLGLMLEQSLALTHGTKVLHFAPEGALADYIERVVGKENYDARDIDPSRYRDGVTTFDLCNDLSQLPSNYYDVIIHNHVIEHLPCNFTVVLQKLHASLNYIGTHYFSVPIYGEKYDACFSDIGEKERVRRFGQFDHVRRFGSDDLHKTLGMIFNLPEKYDLSEEFAPETLQAAAISPEVQVGFTGHTIFRMRKADLK